MAQYIWGDTGVPLPELDFVVEDKSWTKFLPRGGRIVENKGHGSSLYSQCAKVTVESEDGSTRAYFIKLTELPVVGKLMAEGEYLSMVKLHTYGPDLTPTPIGWGTFDKEPSLSFYMSTFIDMHDERFPRPDKICPQLAAMHKRSVDDPDNPGMFGWEHITCAGTIVQQNKYTISWEAFFLAKMQYLIALDEDVHGPCAEYEELKPSFFDNVIPRLLRPLETDGRTLKPTFIHGDIYHLNAVSQATTGNAAMIFDPASHWAHNEFDLFEWSAPRYWFNKSYRDEYFRHFPPSEPAEDVNDRSELYAITAEVQSSALYPSSTQYREYVIDRIRGLVNKFPNGYTGKYKRRDHELAEQTQRQTVEESVSVSQVDIGEKEKELGKIDPDSIIDVQ